MSNVYVDIGAYNGDTMREYLAAHPDCDSAYGFEPTPYLPEWEQVIRDYPNVAVRFIQKAAWIHDGTTILTLADYHSQSNTIMEECEHFYRGRQIPVECLDILEWLQANTSDGDRITLKIDAEGAEYDILDRLINDGIMDRVAYLAVEFHDWIMPSNYAVRHEDIISKCPIPIAGWR